MRVSLVDVAAKAGVSAGTVSRVLSGSPAARIPPSTQERILRVVAEMGYRPNIHARSLRGKQTRTLGVAVGGLGNPFHVGVARALSDAAAEAGYQSLFFASLTEPWSYPGWEKSSWPVDGAIVWSRYGIEGTEGLGAQAGALPLVFLGYEGERPADSVRFDTHGGARAAVEHLVRSGYRRIMYVGPRAPTGGPDENRGKAYAEVCGKAGLPTAFHYLDAGPDYASRHSLHAGLELAALSAAHRPDAVFCYNDLIAIGVYHGLRRAGLRVPHDIGVVGFDGTEEGQCLDLPLTTVLCPVTPFASAAIGLALRRVSGDAQSEPTQTTVATSLLIGATAP